jgi:hypothetical protein
VIADLSRHHVEPFVLEEGYTVERWEHDYGYDLTLVTFDDQGYAEPGFVFLQLKAAETLDRSGTNYVFDLDVRDYRLWTVEVMPVILVLFDATRRRAYWLHVQGYFGRTLTRHPKKGAKTVRVRVPGRQAVSHKAIATMRAHKQEVLDRTKGV